MAEIIWKPGAIVTSPGNRQGMVLAYRPLGVREDNPTPGTAFPSPGECETLPLPAGLALIAASGHFAPNELPPSWSLQTGLRKVSQPLRQRLYFVRGSLLSNSVRANSSPNLANGIRELAPLLRGVSKKDISGRFEVNPPFQFQIQDITLNQGSTSFSIIVNQAPPKTDLALEMDTKKADIILGDSAGPVFFTSHYVSAPSPKEGEIRLVSLKGNSAKDHWNVRPASGRWANTTPARLYEGDIIQILRSGTFKVLQGHVVGGTADLCGCPTVIFPHPYLGEGEKVQVENKELQFRQRRLEGLRGTVLLSTDANGNVGVEFEQDLHAGSFDGLGAQGKCLFVPAECLKKHSG